MLHINWIFENQLAFVLGLACLGVVTFYNWWKWRREKALLAVKVCPLPVLEEWPSLPYVSVLVAAWDEADHIEQHILSFLGLRYPKKELILCAGGSDGTYEKASGLSGDMVLLLKQLAGEGKQKALLRCFSCSRGEVIFFTDADCVLEDETFERTLYPIPCKKEQATSGGSRPFPDLLTNPLVLVQAASDLRMYSETCAPQYSPGLLGRNCAVARSLLLSSKGLEHPAASGTDYVLAKMIRKNGACILQVRESQILTDYPQNLQSYWRQRRRWLRNVVIHGQCFHETKEVLRSLLTSVLGLSLLIMPFLVFLAGYPILLLWGSLILHGYLSRVRYLSFMEQKLKIRFPLRQYGFLFISLFLDFAGWALPLFDYPSRSRQQVW